MLRSLLAASLLLVVVAVPPAGAVGTAGVELTPEPAVTADGRTVTAFHVGPSDGPRTTRRYRLRNLTNAPATVQLYAASAERGGTGGYAVGGPGSAPWIELDAERVTLAPRAERAGAFVVAVERAPRAAGTVYGAIVLERAAGSVVTRAATLVYVEPRAARAPRSRVPALAGAAGLLLALAIGGAVLLSRRRRARPAADGAPAVSLRFGRRRILPRRR